MNNRKTGRQLAKGEAFRQSRNKIRRGGGAPHCSHHCSSISLLHCDGQALPQVGEWLGFPSGLFEMAALFLSGTRKSLALKGLLSRWPPVHLATILQYQNFWQSDWTFQIWESYITVVTSVATTSYITVPGRWMQFPRPHLPNGGNHFEEVGWVQS